MSYYNKCDLCGANLDPGENCDCNEREVKRNAERLYLHKSEKGKTVFLQRAERTSSDRNRGIIRGNRFIPGLLLSLDNGKVKEAPRL